MSYIDPKKLAEAALSAVTSEKKTPDPAASLKAGRASDSPNSASKPFSMAKMARFMLDNRNNLGGGDHSKLKYEYESSQRLKGMYFPESGAITPHPGSAIVPLDTAALLEQTETSEDERFARELHERVKGYDARQVDQDVVRHHEKSMNLSADEDGGILRGPAKLGDIIDYMRNVMVFEKAGATTINIPSNGLMKLPKQTGATQSFHEGEGYTLTPETQMKFGVLEIVLKKMFSISRITNEMTRFASVDAEAILRADMSKSAARVQDRTMLQGLSAALINSGAKAPRGLISYGRPGTPLTAWQEGLDFLLQYTASEVGATGDTFQPEDVAKMISVLPDEVQESDNLKFVGRNDFWAAISNRRADSVTAGDGKGQFVFNTYERGTDYKQVKKLNGYPYIGSSQVSNARVKGGATNLTYLLAGDFTHWVIGRLPVAEFLPNALADSNYSTDTTSLRMIQYYDAGPRNASAFVLCDSLKVQ